MLTLLAADQLPPVEPATGAVGRLAPRRPARASARSCCFLGGRRTDRCGHLVGVATVVLSFVYGVGPVLPGHVRGPASSACSDLPLFELVRRSGALPVELGLLPRPAGADVRPAHHRRRLADPHLLRRLHGPRPAPAPFFALLQPVRRGDAAARPGQQLPRPLRGLGGRRPGVVPADRLLLRPARSRRPRPRRRSIANRVGDVGLSLAIMHHVRATSAPRSTPRSSPAPASTSHRARRRRSRCCCCSARAASPASSRCRPGCPTPWRARPRCRRSSTRRRWSPPAST